MWYYHFILFFYKILQKKSSENLITFDGRYSVLKYTGVKIREEKAKLFYVGYVWMSLLKFDMQGLVNIAYDQ